MYLSRPKARLALLAVLLSAGAHAETTDGSNNTAASGTLAAVNGGQNNSAYGVGALQSLSSGQDNSAFGRNALNLTTTANGNSAFGASAMRAATSGYFNSAFGFEALKSDTRGAANVAVGALSLGANTTGSGNVAIGYSAMASNQRGGGNTALGGGALGSNTSGNTNVALGVGTLNNNTTGNGNIAIGLQALHKNTTANYNIAIGLNSLFKSFGTKNIAIGNEAGYNLTYGINNIMIDNQGAALDTRTIRIGTQGRQNATFIAGIRGINVTGGLPVVVKSNGQLGIQASSRRFKEDIRPMADASDRLLQLTPVTFRYKLAEADGSKPVQYGLIAEDVAKVFPELVAYGEDGQPESVAYQTLSSLLLNEFQKQHHALEASRAALAAATHDAERRDAELLALRAEVTQLKAITTELVAAREASRKLVAEVR